METATNAVMDGNEPIYEVYADEEPDNESSDAIESQDALPSGYRAPTQPLKYWGGKSYQAKTIIGLMPKHLHYVEPYFGGGAVLLQKDPFDETKYWGDKGDQQGVSEVINDINLGLTNFWQVLQNEQTFQAFKRIVDAIPFSQVEWDESELWMNPTEPLAVGAAVSFFVRCRQSRAGQFESFAPLTRDRTRRLQSEQASAWLNCVDGLPAVHSRLKRVVILNDNAINVIRTQDSVKTLFYLDPPYLHETRVSTDVYQYEMTETDHQNLLACIKECQGKVMLSGYRSPLYDSELADWNRFDHQIDNKAAGGKTKRKMTEAIWMNF